MCLNIINKKDTQEIEFLQCIYEIEEGADHVLLKIRRKNGFLNSIKSRLTTSLLKSSGSSNSSMIYVNYFGLK
jgi:hypothetical protein